MKEYIATYAAFLRAHVVMDRPLRIVFDASNGLSAEIFKATLEGTKFLDVVFINDAPDGRFPAHGPNPLGRDALKDAFVALKEKNADLAVVLDDDGDRAVFLDERGEEVSPYAMALWLSGRLSGPLVLDEYLYMVFTSLIGNHAPSPIVSKVGHYYMKQAMVRSGATIGAELSGHYYFRDFFGLDSGLFALIQVVNHLSKTTSPISKILSVYPEYVILSEDIESEKSKPDFVKRIEHTFAGRGHIAKRDGVSVNLDVSWFNIRPSNNEPLMRFTVGAPTHEAAHRLLSEVRKIVD